MIHRDVKPDNIFLHRTLMGVTVTKLLDSGIVSLLDASSVDTAGRFLGTLRYAAPEQLLGEKSTAKTDLYSAALVLYEIVAGRGPFDDEGDAHRIAAAHIHKAPIPVAQFVDVPRELDALLLAALSKSPDGRPRDAFSFAASLRHLKRRIDDTRFREATENRVTAPAVIGPASTPKLPTRESAGAGVFAVSTAADARRPTASPRSTLIGVPPRTPTPPVSQTSPFPSSVLEAARRVAATNSIAFDTVPTPNHGTQPIPTAGPSGAANLALGEADTEIQWPPERPSTQSDGPQVRSLPAGGSPRRAVRPIAFGVIGTAAFATGVGPAHRYPGGLGLVGGRRFPGRARAASDRRGHPDPDDPASPARHAGPADERFERPRREPAPRARAPHEARTQARDRHRHPRPRPTRPGLLAPRRSREEQKDQKIRRYEDGSEEAIGALIEVHRALAPPLPPSASSRSFVGPLLCAADFGSARAHAGGGDGGVFGPGVPRVFAHELLAELRIKALPEAGEVGSGLDGAVVGREELHHDRHPPCGDARSLMKAEEVLEARRDARGFSGLVPDGHGATAAERHALGGEAVDLAGPHPGRVPQRVQETCLP